MMKYKFKKARCGPFGLVDALLPDISAQKCS